MIHLCPDSETPESKNQRYGGRRSSTAAFIAKAQAVHGRFYDYGQVAYTGSATKVTIGCPEHGPFTQTPNNHLAGRGCPGCMVRTGRPRKHPKETV